MALNVDTVMSGLGTRLATIAGLRVYAYPADDIAPPAGVVHFPEKVEYDSTMARGGDEIDIEVSVLVGRVHDRTARTRLGAYLAGSGATSVKTAIEADRTLGGAADSARVRRATVSVMTVAGIDYLSASFMIHVIG